MPQKVAIVATGQTKHTSKRTDVNLRELITEAVRPALEEAGLKVADCDAVMIGNMEPFEGFMFPELWSVESWRGSEAFRKVQYRRHGRGHVNNCRRLLLCCIWYLRHRAGDWIREAV